MASLVRYFGIRSGTQVLLSSLLREGDIVTLIDQKEPWILEVQAWFVTAFLNARYTLLQIVRREGPKAGQEVPRSKLRLCQIILFRNNDYTNVNFIGLLVSILALLLICGASFREKIVLSVGVGCRKPLSAICRGSATLVEILVFCARKIGRRRWTPAIPHSLADQAARIFPFRRQNHPGFPRSWAWPFWYGNGRSGYDHGLGLEMPGIDPDSSP